MRFTSSVDVTQQPDRRLRSGRVGCRITVGGRSPARRPASRGPAPPAPAAAPPRPPLCCRAMPGTRASSGSDPATGNRAVGRGLAVCPTARRPGTSGAARQGCRERTWSGVRRGGQRKFSDHAIETALTLRLVFRLPLRQAEGFLRSVLTLMNVHLEAPDHTTLSRRSQHLDVRFHMVPANEPLHLIVDSTGLSIVGEGEWAAVRNGGRGSRPARHSRRNEPAAARRTAGRPRRSASSPGTGRARWRGRPPGSPC